MIRRNKVKEKLRRGEVVFGCIVSIPHPAIAEILGMVGFDYIMMDGEHGTLNSALLENMVRACDSAGVVSMARLPVNNPQDLEPLIDTGILGAMVPHCVVAEDASRLVQGVKYSPLGKRGVGPGRVSMYGAVPVAEQIREWNEQMLAIPMAEDADAVRNMPEILRVPGIDVICIGVADLANSMGYPGQVSHSAVQEAISTITKQTRDAGLGVMLAPRTMDPGEVKHYVDMGVNIIMYGDSSLLCNSATTVLRGAKGVVGQS